MFRFLQNLLNLPEIKLLPLSDIIFLGKPLLRKKTILHVSIRLTADRFSVFLMTGNLLS